MILTLTGHRPERITNESLLETRVTEAFIAARPDCVIGGLASGFDLWAASIAIDLGIPVCSAKPWTTHGPRKSDEDLYNYVVRNSEEVYVVTESDTYPGPWVYQVRNEWMVDEGDELLAYWDGVKKGGTWNCIRYANKMKRPMYRNVYEILPE